MPARENVPTVQVTPVFFLGMIFAISGLLVGFLVAGYVTVLAVALLSLLFGVLIGWHSRGLLG